MKIMTNRTFNDLMQQLTNQAVTINKLLSENKRLKEENYRLLKGAYTNAITHAKPIIFPNTDERGLGDSDTPANLSDKYF